MKKSLFYFLVITAAFALISACSKEMSESVATENDNINLTKVTLMGSIPGNASSKVYFTDPDNGSGIKTYWSDKDSLLLQQTSNESSWATHIFKKIASTSDPLVGKFAGELTSPKDAELVRCIYPATFNTTSNFVDYSIPCNSLSDVQNRTIMYGVVAYYKSSNNLSTIHFLNVTSILRIKLTFPKQLKIKQIEMYGDDIINRQKINFTSEETWTWDTTFVNYYLTGPMTSNFSTPQSTSSGNVITVYMAAIPQSVNGVNFTAVDEDSRHYRGKISTSPIEFKAGKVHTISVNMTESIIGQYLFSDGTWGTLADKATTTVYPIGVIFSDKPSDTDKSHGWIHGYAMALTNAHTYADWTKDYYDENITNITYAKDFIPDKDGYTNCQVLINNPKASGGFTAENYPAFWYAVNFGTSNVANTEAYAAPLGTSGWYLPSLGQWYDIIVNLGGINGLYDPRTSTSKNLWFTNFQSPVDETDYIDNVPLRVCTNLNNYIRSAFSADKSGKLSVINLPYFNASATNYDGDNYWSSTEVDSVHCGMPGFLCYSSADRVDLDCAYSLKTSDDYTVSTRPVIAF